VWLSIGVDRIYVYGKDVGRCAEEVLFTELTDLIPRLPTAKGGVG